MQEVGFRGTKVCWNNAWPASCTCRERQTYKLQTTSRPISNGGNADETAVRRVGEKSHFERAFRTYFDVTCAITLTSGAQRPFPNFELRRDRKSNRTAGGTRILSSKRKENERHTYVLLNPTLYL